MPAGSTVVMQVTLAREDARMTHRAFGLALIALCCGVARSSGQAPTGTITGHVTDAPTGRPVVGVRIAVVGMDRGAITREDGGFVIADVPDGAHRVRASRIGFTPQE